LAYYIGDDEKIDPIEANRQRQISGLIRTLFLKRFESSVRAFEISCDRLLRKLLAFLDVHSESKAETKRLDRWIGQNQEVLDYATHRQLSLWGGESDDDEDDDTGFRCIAISSQ
jgi:hypothetical protein